MPTIKTARMLSFLIAVLAALASAGGLLLEGLYRDNLFVSSAWKGNDLVTLVIAVPILVAALILAARGPGRAVLVWVGMLDYMLYNYAFYLFAAAFNWFFLLYVALFGLSIFALIFLLVNLDVPALARRFSERTPRGWIAGYMLLVGIGLSVVYIAQSVGFILTGQLPAIVEKTGHPTSIVFALDMTLVIPFFILGAIWLLQGKPWGFLLAGAATVKGPLYTLVLTVDSLWAARAGVPGAGAEIPIWLTLTVVGLIATALLYANMNAKQVSRLSPTQPMQQVGE
jgi:hypothetical protein